MGAVKLEVNDKNSWLIEAQDVKTLKNTLLKAQNLSEEMLQEKKNESIKMIEEFFLWSVIIDKHIEVFKKITQN